MTHYTKGVRYTRPPTSDHMNPRFNSPLNRHHPRNNLGDLRPPRPNDSQLIPSNKPTTGTTSVTMSSTTTVDSSVPSVMTKSEPTNLSNSPANVSDNNSNAKSSEEARSNVAGGGQKRPHPDQQQASSVSQKATQGGRSRLFIGNVPSDITETEFKALFGKYGELIEYYVNPPRGFGFVKLSSRHFAEQAKYDLDGITLRGKALRIRFASQGAIVKVKNLSPNVSNELLKDAFQQYFGAVERAVIIVDDRGKSTGEGIIEFEKKPSAQKCLNECTEQCFFITHELKPIIVEPWDMKDEDDGLPEKSLVRNDVYFKEREQQPRFAEPDTIEYRIGLKWKELEIQEKQLLEQVKSRMQQASEQLQIEIDRMLLEHQAQMIRDELTRRQEDLRRIDELRSYDLERRRNMMSMHQPDAYNMPVGNVYHQNSLPPSAVTAHQYNFQQGPYPNAPPYVQAQPSSQIDAAYTTNQVARGFNVPGGPNVRPGGPDYNPHQPGFDRKRPRY